ncbi:HD domain-containing protein [Amycolatopsis thermoflava]|uniref:HD domain-containing protein n=1 Tax=Amycolatopsis thermoflava TaxID=84480 RepID=UPI000F4C342C|nr:HD domain-containing protein [Amycolatopsis thermoflava]
MPSAIDHDFPFGGYAKRTPELDAFTSDFKARHGITLDWVYEAKMMDGLFDRIASSGFAPPELLFVAALLHDIGLVAEFDSQTAPFEVAGWSRDRRHAVGGGRRAHVDRGGPGPGTRRDFSWPAPPVWTSQAGTCTISRPGSAPRCCSGTRG